MQRIGSRLTASNRPKALPEPSDVVPFWVWYGLLVGTLIRTTKKVLHGRA